MENNNKRYGWGLLIIVMGFFVWRYVSNPLVVTVSGSGKVAVTSSTARLTVSAVATGETVEQVVTEVNNKVAALRLAMVTGGVKEKEITQAQIQVTPLAAVVSGAKGYSATITLFAQTAEVAKVADLVVRLYGAGASIVSQPVVEVSNQRELENVALMQALDDAAVNAKYLAALRGKIFKKAMVIQQASSGNVATATKTEAGENGTTSSFEVAKAVSVTYWMW